MLIKVNKERRILNMTTPLCVSNNILQRAFNENIKVTPMKLQKIIYFVYRDYLQETGIPLFNERFQTWQYGPVLESIYYAYKCYSKKNITKFYSANGKILSVDEDSSPIFRYILDKVWMETKMHSGIELSNITHLEGSAWHKAFIEGRLYLFDNDIREEKIAIE